MKSKQTINSAFISLLIFAQSVVLADECNLPTPDGTVTNPSPPSVQGVITKASPGKITVSNKNEKNIITYENETKLFTVYGGIVFAREIMVGQHVLVWYEGCRKSTKPNAVVIQFCSTGAEPCIK
jgi:hypothetical protein